MDNDHVIADEAKQPEGRIWLPQVASLRSQ